MGHQIRMVPAVDKWVAKLEAPVRNGWNGMPPSSAARRMLGKIGFWVAVPGMDAAYQRHLAALTLVRRTVASVATSRKRLELQIAGLEHQAEAAADSSRKVPDAGQDSAADQGHTTGNVAEQLADLRRQYANLQAREERVAAASRRLAAEIDAFRTGNEAMKAAYSAAEEAAEAVWAVRRHSA
jgi:phage shock protein A